MNSTDSPPNLSDSFVPTDIAASKRESTPTPSTRSKVSFRLEDGRPVVVGEEKISASPARHSEIGMSTEAVLSEMCNHLRILASKDHTTPTTAERGIPANPPTNPTDETKNAPPQTPKFGDLEDYWSHFDEAAKQESDGMIKGMKDNLDNLLIFAALFSAVNAGFLALSLPMLSDDPLAETNTLLRLLVQGADNSTMTPADLLAPPFTPSHVNWVVNQLFSTSLTLSLLASFGALVAQQWIVHYTRQTPGASDGGRWDRERKFEGAQRWKLQEVVEMLLSILLQAALFVFIVGFIIFLRDLGWPVALPNLILIIIGPIAFIASTLLSSWDPFCPFQTPFTTIAVFTARHGCVRIAQNIARAWCAVREMLGLGYYEMERTDPERWRGSSKIAWAFDTSRSALAHFQRPTEATEALLECAVRRFLEMSGHVQLLKATAINLPLPFNEINDEEDVEYKDGRLRRLASLLQLAHGRDNQEERRVYATAIMHLILTERDLDTHHIPFYILQDSLSACTEAQLEAPPDSLPNTTPSVATSALGILVSNSPDSMEGLRAMGCTQFIHHVLSREQLRPRPMSSILTLMMLFFSWQHADRGDILDVSDIPGFRRALDDLLDPRSLPAAPMGQVVDRFTVPMDAMSDWFEMPERIHLELLRKVIGESTQDCIRTIKLTKEAFVRYDPQNDLTHDLIIGIAKLLGKAVDTMDEESLGWMSLVVEGLEGWFTPRETSEKQETEKAKIKRHEAVEAAIDLISRLWSEGKRYSETLPTLLKALRLSTVYMEAIGRRREDGQSRLVLGKSVVRLLEQVHRFSDLQNKEEVFKFKRTVASLPEDIVKLPEELKEWVDEALLVGPEGEKDFGGRPSCRQVIRRTFQILFIRCP